MATVECKGAGTCNLWQDEFVMDSLLSYYRAGISPFY